MCSSVQSLPAGGGSQTRIAAAAAPLPATPTNLTATGGVVGQVKRAFTAAIKEATSAVDREAEREGLTPDRLGRKVSRVVSHVKQAVTDAVEEA